MYLKPLTLSSIPCIFIVTFITVKRITLSWLACFLKNHGVEKHVRISKSCELNGMGFHLHILSISELMSWNSFPTNLPNWDLIWPYLISSLSKLVGSNFFVSPHSGQRLFCIPSCDIKVPIHPIHHETPNTPPSPKSPANHLNVPPPRDLKVGNKHEKKPWFFLEKMGEISFRSSSLKKMQTIYMETMWKSYVNVKHFISLL